MEKLTIKPWQVMQAHENGAKIECTNKNDDYPWIEPNGVVWNFPAVKYRIANLTADGMRLDELVEKYPEKITMKPTKSGMGFMLTGEEYLTGYLIQLLVEHPEEIKHVRVKGEEKKLRPWTMAEFEKHRDEWFKLKNTKEPVFCKITAYGARVVTISGYSVSYEELLLDYTFAHGSPCGVLE